MVEKVQLKDDKTMYVVLSPIYPNSDSNSDNGSLLTCFPYKNSNQELQLEKAREWADKRAEALGITLEESLT